MTYEPPPIEPKADHIVGNLLIAGAVLAYFIAGAWMLAAVYTP